MKRKPHPVVTETELAILECLWRREAATIAELTADLYPNQTASEYGTVQSLLQRLEAKGCVERERGGRAHRFRAVVAHGDIIGHQLRELADRLCEGSLTPLLTHLIQSRRLKRDELGALRTLLAELDDSQPTRRRP